MTALWGIRRFITIVSMCLQAVTFLSIFCLLLPVASPAQEGTIQVISGDLVYISGINESAPEGSLLGTPDSRTASLEVIKHANNMVVARKLDQQATFRKSDRLVTISRAGGSLNGKARRKAIALAVAKGPRIDGRLDDAAWKDAIPVDGFIQRDPDYWMPSTERTVAKVVYDDKSVYFAFECFMSCLLYTSPSPRD